MPTLADSERPDDDAGVEGPIVPPELVAVLIEIRDENAVDVELEMDTEESTVVLIEIRDENVVDVGLEMDTEESTVVLKIRDENVVDVRLEMDTEESTVILELRDSDAIGVEGLESTIDVCPRVRSLLGSLQQLSPSSNGQHQIPKEIGGHVMIAAPPPLAWSRFT
ncbi:hypothetical protein MMC22_011373 [Lobaria immixta]|nr:hypothetical protein [Lobaria immixta]